MKEMFENIFPYLESEEVDKLQLAYTTVTSLDDSTPLKEALKMRDTVGMITAEQVEAYDQSISILKKRHSDQIKEGTKLLKEVHASFKQRELDKGRIVQAGSLQHIAKSIDPALRLDHEVEEILMEETGEFLDTLIKSACEVASYRKADTVDICDVQTVLELKYDMKVPWPITQTSGSSSSTTSSVLFKPAPFVMEPTSTPFHQRRLAAVAKSREIQKILSKGEEAAN
eukprot:MONOS_11417.1-p1 / transcript=MONOS_11417.1 / gene=MONOS_11417 / organism=Monocercomonoides_exilis_PA203 / gene_product=Transcription initiation factor TFIID subunit 12 / transcript_product=Transcription initiation factor TFIID subunit 12 / location=Mono_scaffold00572:15160-15976(-) / protein_length=228 / sequence_SO=supercontig / SO=protein_coding / is_pseudo=false